MKRLGAVVLGISKDSTASHKKFAEKFDLPFVLLSDPEADVMKKYQAFGKKMMYGRSVEGTRRWTSGAANTGFVATAAAPGECRRWRRIAHSGYLSQRRRTRS